MERAVRFALRELGIADDEFDLAKEAETQRNVLQIREQTLDRVREFSRADFSTFGYERNSPPDGLFEIVD